MSSKKVLAGKVAKRQEKENAKKKETYERKLANWEANYRIGPKPEPPKYVEPEKKAVDTIKGIEKTAAQNKARENGVNAKAKAEEKAIFGNRIFALDSNARYLSPIHDYRPFGELLPETRLEYPYWVCSECCIVHKSCDTGNKCPDCQLPKSRNGNYETTSMYEAEDLAKSAAKRNRYLDIMEDSPIQYWICNHNNGIDDCFKVGKPCSVCGKHYEEGARVYNKLVDAFSEQ